MIQKKICMLGAFAVGKTSLVQRFVHSLYSDKYLTTVGVKIDKKALSAGGSDVTLMLWDLAGEDDFTSLRTSYLRGGSGYLLVVDGTRRATLDTALGLHKTAREVMGDVPFTLVVNKADLADQWEIDTAVVDKLAEEGWDVLPTSAKSGEGVEDAFTRLAERMVGGA